MLALTIFKHSQVYSTPEKEVFGNRWGYKEKWGVGRTVHTWQNNGIVYFKLGIWKLRGTRRNSERERM
jgi:hypothetical protein